MAKLTIDIAAKIDKLKSGLKSSGKSVKDWGRRVKADMEKSVGRPIKPKMDNRQVKRKIKETDSLWKQFRRGISKPISLRSLLGGITAIGVGIGAFLYKSAKLAASFEKMTIAFTTMTGSAGKAKDLIAELIEFSKNTPFTPEQTQKAGKTLLAFGVAAGDVTKTLRFLGDISAGTGKDLSEMAIIFGQIRGAGRLMGQDLLQLITAGFNPLQEISKQTGRSMRDLKDDMRNGAISFKMVEDAFKSATGEGGKFFNMMENQSKSLGGQLTILEGSVSDLMRQFGELTLPELKIIVKGAQSAVQTLEELATARRNVDAANAGEAAGEGGGFEGASAGQKFAMTAIKELGGMLGMAGEVAGVTGAGKDAGKRGAEGIINLLRRAVGNDALDADGVGFKADTLPGVEKKKAARAKKAADEEQARKDKEIADQLTAEQAAKEASFSGIIGDSDFDSADPLGDMQREQLRKAKQVAGKERAEQDEKNFEDAKAAAKKSAGQGIKALNEQAQGLQKTIGEAFQPGGKIQSRLATIGGERTINVDRQIPQKQLDQLMEVNKQISALTKSIESIDGLAFPGAK